MATPYSAVDICNQALSMVGGDFIRALDESTKRSRACSVFYPMLRDYLLTRLDWPFAKKLVLLKPLDEDQPLRVSLNVQVQSVVPEGWYAYQMPNDCAAPRDLHPPGSKERWKQFHRTILAMKPPESEPKLYYTALIDDTSLFSMTFVNLLSLGIAARLAPSIAQDKGLASSLHQQWLNEQYTVFADDANIGEDYRSPDEQPLNDPFVDPFLVSEALFEDSSVDKAR